MDSEDQEPERVQNLYRQEFELLKGMFEEHFSEEVIAGVLEDCDGDVNLAVDTLTNIESENSKAENQANNVTATSLPAVSRTDATETSVAATATKTSVPMSYAGISQIPATITPAVTKTLSSHQRKYQMPEISHWSDQIRKIVTNYNEGSRILIVMRGAPGSGKSYLARAIVEATVGTSNSVNPSNHIFSSDDHFYRNGKYQYNVTRLDEVHMRNQQCVHKALARGVSPVIVDNTNMKTWEMYPYVQDGVRNGYIIEVVEPSNPWSKNAGQLAKKNSHGVPKEKIQLMLERYEGFFTGANLIKYFKLVYPEDLVPPVLRNIPAYIKPTPATSVLLPELITAIKVNNSSEISQTGSSTKKDEPSRAPHHNRTVNETAGSSKIHVNSNSTTRNNHVTNTSQEYFDEIAKLEVEWEKGETWEDPRVKLKPKLDVASSSDPKPQRSKACGEGSQDFMKSLNIENDWSKIALFMPPWIDGSKGTNDKNEQTQVKTNTATTCFEIGDLTNESHKILIAAPRYINDRNHESDRREKIPNQRMLDKSTATHEPFVVGVYRCKQEDKHFNAMKKMFKNISRPVLREIFDQCNGDVNWASDVVLEDIDKKHIQKNTEDSDSEEEEEDYCECWATYNIIPDKTTQTISPVPVQTTPPCLTPTFVKKPKKDKIVSDDSIQVKRQIEKNIMISENHYSEHNLRIRRTRREFQGSNDLQKPAIDKAQNKNEIKPEITKQNTPAQTIEASTFDTSVAGTSRNVDYRNIPSTSSGMAVNNETTPNTSAIKNREATEADFDEDDSLESDDDRSISSNDNNFISVNIGMEFVKQLDEKFGRGDFEYPEGVKPVLNIPKSILDQINALWIESISNQLDKNNTQTEEMIEQDAELARQVALDLEEKEEEEEYSDEELMPSAAMAVPRELDFKEIMDSDLALAIYEKEVKEEWKSKEPQDIAAKMTREKLHKLFPDVDKEVLSEFLMAHNNNFMVTVESLMTSTGLTHYFQNENPVEAFIKEREKENEENRQQQAAEVNFGLDTREWPSLLSKDGLSQNVLTLEEVEKMRERAEAFKVSRDKYFMKAKMCYDLKKLQEASFYSKQAAELTAHYERASNYAAAMLMHVHASNYPDSNVIDLHFLRVPEALTTLDLFIDCKVNLMRSQTARGVEPKPLVLHIITGRGKHSPGRARVKPAVMKRLTERGMTFRTQNPGLLEAKIKASHQITTELVTV